MFAGVGDIGALAGFKPGGLEMIAMHSVAGCVSAQMGGGSCKQGALSAGFAQAAGPYTQDLGKVGDLAATAAVGGTSSVLGGGKFQDGAMTAAYGRMFNDWLHPPQPPKMRSGVQNIFGDGRMASGDPTAPLGHSDFYGGDEFDYTAEDHGLTSPYLQPWRHFRPLEQSLAEAQRAIDMGDANAFARAMHRSQDYYTHYGKDYRWAPGNFQRPCGGFGHVCTTAPDNDPAAWGQANKMTQEMVNKWHQRQ